MVSSGDEITLRLAAETLALVTVTCYRVCGMGTTRSLGMKSCTSHDSSDCFAFLHINFVI